MKKDNPTTEYLRMNDAAKLLDTGYGRNTLFQKLRELKIFDAQNVPYQQFIDRGYFKLILKPRPYHKGLDKVPLISLKGLEYLKKKLAEKQNPSTTNPIEND